MTLHRKLALLVGIFILVPVVSQATSCVDGVDCFCDTVSAPNDSKVIMCEDFQAAGLYEGGSGNWVQNQPGGERGAQSWWTQTYSFGNKVWRNGEPNANPRVGDQCVVTGGSGCNATYEWCSEQQGNLIDGKGRDCWQGNGYGPLLDIQRDGDAGDEVPSLSDPSGGNPQGQWLAHRVASDSSSGIKGQFSLPSLKSIGITSAYAYAPNIQTAGVVSAPWKHNEFSPRNRAALHGFSSSPIGLVPEFPYQGFITPNDFCQSGQSLVAGITAGKETGQLVAGTIKCDSRFRWTADPRAYNQSTDWPLGTWGCMKTRVTNLDTDNVCITQWFNDKVVVDFCGLDGTGLSTQEGVTGMSWNAYSNAWQVEPIGHRITETSYRYEDNWVITDGEPVSCEAVLGGGGAPPPSNARPPAPPVLLPVQ